MALEILPSIDLREGRVVRLAQGDFARQTTYTVSPVDVVDGYRKAGARWLHLVDLDGAKEGRVVQYDLIRSITAARENLYVQVGGGVRTQSDVDRLIEAGAARVVVGTAAMDNWAWFESLAGQPGYMGRLTLALDARDGVIATKGWTASSGRMAVDVARAVKGWPLAAILYTDVAKDGLLQGPNVEMTRRLAEASDVPIIASGGVGDISHIAAVRDAGNIWGVVVGRALYEGKISLVDALRVAAEPARN